MSKFVFCLTTPQQSIRDQTKSHQFWSPLFPEHWPLLLMFAPLGLLAEICFTLSYHHDANFVSRANSTPEIRRMIIKQQRRLWFCCPTHPPDTVVIIFGTLSTVDAMHFFSFGCKREICKPNYMSLFPIFESLYKHNTA